LESKNSFSIGNPATPYVMAPTRSNLTDKNIVDRTNVRRNSDVARAVRKTREQLAQQSGNPDFERELLRLHSQAMAGSALAIPMLLIIIAIGGVYVGVGSEILVWALVAAICYLPLGHIARRVLASDIEDAQVAGLRRNFLISHAISGVGWVYLVSINCNPCGIANIPTIKAVLLLIAMSATAIIGNALRGALLATFAAPVAVAVMFAVRDLQSVPMAMAALLVAALPFFVYISASLNKSTHALLAFRSEKDWLIAELETAKSMSDEARRRAEEANLAKSRFLASMSHELRTPLNAILGFSEVMTTEVLGPIGNATYRDYAGDIHRSGQHLLELINEILDLSRIEAGRYALNEESLSLAATVEECCHIVELKARGKDIRVIQEIDARLPKMRADERAIRQITLNLLANAIKFTPTGGWIRVRVGWTAGGGQYLSVRDNGPGIPDDEIPIVLSSFGQGSIAIKNAEQGTGLGLPIVQGLVAIHGGDFELHSKLREGTEAIANLPALA
jgi:two-component system cell cycle sensor histidine kinase PleC